LLFQSGRKIYLAILPYQKKIREYVSKLMGNLLLGGRHDALALFIGLRSRFMGKIGIHITSQQNVAR
jgi:hypothetical protein